MEEEAREMESPKEVMASTTSNGELPPPPMMIVKGKRTKRQRVVAATDTTTSSAESKNLQGGEYSTEEEEEMANCLILLAQGSALEHPVAGEKFTSRRFTEAVTTTAGRAGFYVYECKTCNKCFPSFQALGGHRASHKRPKITAMLTAAQTEEGSAVIDEDSLKISMNSFMKPSATGINNRKTRVHECSICGSEFFSGQALGGHMRRHRPVVVAPEGKKERNFLSLDLNLPAPAEEDLRGSPSVGLTLSLAGKRPVIFSPGTTLVDCHY